MAILKLKVTSSQSKLELQKLQVAGGKHEISRRILNFISSVQTGNQGAMSDTLPPSYVVTVQEAEVAASGTFTLTTVIATDAVSVNGVTFTAVASGAAANEFNVGASDTLTAASLAASINASVTALIPGYVTAASSGAVVTVTSAFFGLAGNQTLIASADGTIVASGARLTAGAADAGALTLNF